MGLITFNHKQYDAIYHKYKEKAQAETDVIFGGRLATDKDYAMHQIIGSALATVKKECGE